MTLYLFQNANDWAARHPWEMLLIGAVIGAVLGYLGNLIEKWWKSRGIEAKLRSFIDGLNRDFYEWIAAPPINEDEVIARRTKVKVRVKELSETIFNAPLPNIPTVREEHTAYPELPCKWCHRGHDAFGGSQGQCTNCALPLDLWLGAQGQQNKPLKKS